MPTKKKRKREGLAPKRKTRDAAREADAETFSARLREARQKAGYVRLDDAAAALRVTREGYGRLERGRVLPRADLLLRLARLFNVSTDWLLGLREHAYDDGRKNYEEYNGVERV